MKWHVPFAIVLAACFWPRRYSGPYEPREPGPLAIVAAEQLTRPPCKVTVPPVVGDARWKPSVTSALGVVDVRGEPRLSVDEFATVAWSGDASRIAVADRKTLEIWRARDGSLIDLVRYPVGDMLVSHMAWSHDGRWIALAGNQPARTGDVPVTLVVEIAATGAPTVHVIDETSHPTYREVAARMLAPTQALAGRGVTIRVTPKHDGIELVDPSGTARKLSAFDLESALALVAGGTRLVVARPGELSVYELPAGTLARKVALPGAEMVALSGDGRRVAGWTLARVVLDGGYSGASASPPPPAPSPFLAVWDVETGTQLWRDPDRCCDSWGFSGEGEWLVPPWHRLGSELVAAATGHVVTFPGRVMSVSPDGKLAAIGTRDGLELWTTTGKPAFAPARGPIVLARGANDAVVEQLAAATTLSRGIVIDLGMGAAVLAVGTRCTAVFASQSTRDDHAFAFSADGSQLLGARWSAAGTDAAIVRVADGQPLHAIHAKDSHRVTIIPALARFAFEVGSGVRILDAMSGREVASAPAPRVSYSHGPGLVWDVRDPDGERTSSFGMLAASADGKRLVGATVLRDNVVTIWDLADVSSTIDLPTRGLVSALAVFGDGSQIAAGDRDGRVTLWTGASHTMQTLPESHGWVHSLAFSPDGKLLAAGSNDGTVMISDASNGSSVGSATLVADRPLLITWLDGHTLVVDTARRLAIKLTVTSPP